MRSIRSLVLKYLGSEYRKGFIYIFSAKILIVVITFFTTPILARIYSPGDYGLFAVMNSFALILLRVSSLSLPTCLLVCEELKIQKTVSGIVLYSLMINFLFILAGFLFVGKTVASFSPDFFSVTLIAGSSFIVTVAQIFANLNIRQKAFKHNVVVNVVESILIRLSGLSLGFADLTKYGLFLAELIGKVGNVFAQLWIRRFNIKSLIDLKYLNPPSIKKVIVENREYPLYNFPVTLTGSFLNQVMIWALALYFSRESVGHFSMAIGLVNIPVLLISNSLQPLITSKLFNEATTFSMKLFRSIVLKVLVTCIAIYSLIYIVSPFFIRIYLGPTWLSSVVFIQVMCFPFAIQMMNNSVSGVFIVFKKQRSNFIIKFTFLIVAMVGIALLLHNSADMTSVVIFYAAITVLEELIRLVYIVTRKSYVGGK